MSDKVLPRRECWDFFSVCPHEFYSTPTTNLSPLPMRDSYLHARREQVRRTDNEPLPSPDERQLFARKAGAGAANRQRTSPLSR
jgi:hypothetical protein